MLTQQTKRCRKRHAFTGAYCAECKRLRERARYQSNPEAQRERKRIAYREDHPNASIRVVREAVTMAEQECEHDNASRDTRKAGMVYACLDCGEFINQDFEVIPEPPDIGEPQAGKVQAPHPQNGNGAQKHKSLQTNKPHVYERNTEKMVTGQCEGILPRGNQCQELFKVWPQNMVQTRLCPACRLAHRRQLNTKRQRDFRNRRK